MLKKYHVSIIATLTILFIGVFSIFPTLTTISVANAESCPTTANLESLRATVSQKLQTYTATPAKDITFTNSGNASTLVDNLTAVSSSINAYQTAIGNYGDPTCKTSTKVDFDTHAKNLKTYIDAYNNDVTEFHKLSISTSTKEKTPELKQPSLTFGSKADPCLAALGSSVNDNNGTIAQNMQIVLQGTKSATENQKLLTDAQAAYDAAKAAGCDQALLKDRLDRITQASAGNTQRASIKVVDCGQCEEKLKFSSLPIKQMLIGLCCLLNGILEALKSFLTTLSTQIQNAMDQL